MDVTNVNIHLNPAPEGPEGQLLGQERELEMAADRLNLKYAKYLAIERAALITAKNISYDLAAVEELDTSLCEEAD